MKAAVVTNFDQAPQLQTFPAPTAGDGEQVIDVLAAAVYPRVRSQADGTHYTSTGKLPLIPGLDGVGQTATGQIGYFVNGDETYGALAEQTVVSARRFIPLPADVDVAQVAAMMNPAMSSWMALQDRVGDITDKTVLVLGATGAAGQLAVQVSKYLGAKTVIAAGRDEAKLATVRNLGADQTISLTGNEAEVKAAFAGVADVDVVLDYLWGSVTEQTFQAILPARHDHSQLLVWVEIGSMSGSDITLPSAYLRSVNLRLLGSGQGSINGRVFATELPNLAQLISTGTFKLEVQTLSFAELSAENWHDASQRYVYVM